MATTRYSAEACSRCGQSEEANQIPVLETEDHGPMCEDCINADGSLRECDYCGLWTQHKDYIAGNEFFPCCHSDSCQANRLSDWEEHRDLAQGEHLHGC